VDKIKKSSFGLDIINLTTLASLLFGVGGFLDNNSISESTMGRFLQEHKKEFDKLADEHIKKIELIKHGKNNEK
jgi:hypothetical protein